MARVRHKTFATFIDRGFLFGRTLIKAAAGVYGAYEGHEMVQKLANGKIDWDAVGRAALVGNAMHWVLVGITGISLFVAYTERKLRRSVTSSHSEYIKKLEQIVDPRRTGSKLLPEGRSGKEGQDEA